MLLLPDDRDDNPTAVLVDGLLAVLFDDEDDFRNVDLELGDDGDFDDDELVDRMNVDVEDDDDFRNVERLLSDDELLSGISGAI